jgi:hypothetical protein
MHDGNKHRQIMFMIFFIMTSPPFASQGVFTFLALAVEAVAQFGEFLLDRATSC